MNAVRIMDLTVPIKHIAGVKWWMKLCDKQIHTKKNNKQKERNYVALFVL